MRATKLTTAQKQELAQRIRKAFEGEGCPGEESQQCESLDDTQGADSAMLTPDDIQRLFVFMAGLEEMRNALETHKGKVGSMFYFAALLFEEGWEIWEDFEKRAPNPARDGGAQ